MGVEVNYFSSLQSFADHKILEIVFSKYYNFIKINRAVAFPVFLLIQNQGTLKKQKLN